MKYLKMYALFLYISATTFGGGYAMLSVFDRELVAKRGWVTSEELRDYYAVAQSTPGVVSVNTATFVGVKQAGVLGGVAATLGVITPSVVLSCIFGGLLAEYSGNRYVNAIIHGMSIAAMACVSVTVAGIVRGEFKMWYVILIAFGLSAVSVPGYLISVLFLLLAVWSVLRREKSNTSE
jgi:chromate transporter